MAPSLIETDDCGLRCAPGGFHVDPWTPVDVAVLTHGHGDHARPGSALYHCAAPALPVMRKRLGEPPRIVAHEYGAPFELRGTRVSFHPAGHVLGSAQIRVEHGGEVWVVSEDYKRAADPTCAPFEVIRCDTFITEATFALPIYRWPQTDELVREILDWWETKRAAGRASVLFTYVLGKAQRILAELTGFVLSDHADWPALLRTIEETGATRVQVTHGYADPLVRHLRERGVDAEALRTPFVGEPDEPGEL